MHPQLMHILRQTTVQHDGNAAPGRITWDIALIVLRVILLNNLDNNLSYYRLRNSSCYKLPLSLCHSATLLLRHSVAPPATTVPAVMLVCTFTSHNSSQLKHRLPSNTGEIPALDCRIRFKSYIPCQQTKRGKGHPTRICSTPRKLVLVSPPS